MSKPLNILFVTADQWRAPVSRRARDGTMTAQRLER